MFTLATVLVLIILVVLFSLRPTPSVEERCEAVADRAEELASKLVYTDNITPGDVGFLDFTLDDFDRNRYNLAAFCARRVVTEKGDIVSHRICLSYDGTFHTFVLDEDVFLNDDSYAHVLEVLTRWFDAGYEVYLYGEDKGLKRSGDSWVHLS